MGNEVMDLQWCIAAIGFNNSTVAACARSQFVGDEYLTVSGSSDSLFTDLAYRNKQIHKHGLKTRWAHEIRAEVRY